MLTDLYILFYFNVYEGNNIVCFLKYYYFQNNYLQMSFIVSCKNTHAQLLTRYVSWSHFNSLAICKFALAYILLNILLTRAKSKHKQDVLKLIAVNRCGRTTRVARLYYTLPPCIIIIILPI